jgi:hypothetical protein
MMLRRDDVEPQRTGVMEALSARRLERLAGNGVRPENEREEKLAR